MARVPGYAEADLIPMFNGPFAVSAIYTSFGNPPVTFNVIYDRPPDEFGQGAKSRTQKPQIKVQTTNIPSIGRKDTFAINSIVYYVTDFADDGFGVTTVYLSLVAV